MEQVNKAKRWLLMSQPFFASLALEMDYIEDAQTKTASTDGTSMKFNPDYIRSIRPDETTGLIAHEVLHVAFFHHLRENGRNHELWNEACDYAINPILIQQGFKLPPGGLVESRFNGKDAEEIYAILKKENRQPKQDCGFGEVSKPATGVTQEMEAEMKQKITAAMNIAKMAGKETSIIQDEIIKLIQPKIDWQEVLNRFLAEVVKNDYSWKRPNAKYIQLGIYIPILDGMEIGRCIFAMDTSSSVDRELLAEIVSEIKQASSMFRFPVTVIHCDTQIRGVEELEPDNEITPKGRGGTDFRPPFDYVNEHDIMPKALIYLTDGDCDDFPDYYPEYEVLWVIYNNKRFKPPFGEVLYVK